MFGMGVYSVLILTMDYKVLMDYKTITYPGREYRSTGLVLPSRWQDLTMSSIEERRKKEAATTQALKYVPEA